MKYGLIFFFFNDTAPTEISPLSLHDALPIYYASKWLADPTSVDNDTAAVALDLASRKAGEGRSEEHTSELQSQANLVCRLLLAKKRPAELMHLTMNIHSTPAWTHSSMLERSP